MKLSIAVMMGGIALNAQAAPGRPVSPYSAQAVARPLAPGALLTLSVTDKKKTYNRGFLDAVQYQQIRDGALQVVKQYPPKKYHYVTLGRSPTSVAAFLDNLSEHEGDLHTNLPASNLRTGQVQGFEAVWYAHLDRFLPKHVLDGKQRILLIDRSSTGATLTKVKGIFEQYFASRGLKKTVDVIAFARRELPIKTIDITSSPELVHMNSGTYDNVAKYPWFYVGQSDPGILKPLPGYENFKQTLKERMSRDPELDAVIGKADAKD